MILLLSNLPDEAALYSLGSMVILFTNSCFLSVFFTRNHHERLHFPNGIPHS